MAMMIALRFLLSCECKKTEMTGAKDRDACDEASSVGVIGSVAGMWAMRQALLSKNERPAPDTMRSTRGEDAMRIVEDHMSPGVSSSRYVPDFVDECMRRGLADWTSTDGVWTHAASGVRIRQCSASSSSLPREEHAQQRKVIEFILDFLTVLVRHAERPPSFPREIVIATLACDVPRRFPAEKGVPLGPENVNAGVCTFTSDTVRHVLVYRAQHAQKVLMHEIIHACNVGAAVSGSPAVAIAERDIMRSLRYASASGGGLHMDEAYTEILACHAHMFWRVTWEAAVRGDHDAGSVHESWLKHALYAAWDAERRLYMAVCRAIVDHFRPSLMRERTHVMSYFFAKAALWDSSLDEVPALIVREHEAECFARLYRSRLLSDEFWAGIAAVPASEVPATPLMTRV